MSYRLLAPVFDWVAPRLSRYRSPELLTKVLEVAPDGCELLDIGVGALLRPRGYLVFAYEPEIRFSILQSSRAAHIGTFGRASVFRRTPGDVHEALDRAGFTMRADLAFKAYLGLVHHLVIAQPSR